MAKKQTPPPGETAPAPLRSVPPAIDSSWDGEDLDDDQGDEDLEPDVDELPKPPPPSPGPAPVVETPAAARNLAPWRDQLADLRHLFQAMDREGGRRGAVMLAPTPEQAEQLQQLASGLHQLLCRIRDGAPGS